MAKYKIYMKPFRYGNNFTEYYYIKKFHRKWFDIKPRWWYVTEDGYSGKTRISFTSTIDAEKYIKKLMYLDNKDMKPKDIKVYECREGKIDKLLK